MHPAPAVSSSTGPAAGASQTAGKPTATVPPAAPPATTTAPASASSHPVPSTEGPNAEMVTSEGVGGRLGSKRRHYKGPKKHHEKHGSDSDNSPSSSPQQLKPTDTAGAQQATASKASPSTSTQKTTSSPSPPPDNHKPAGDVAIVVKPAFAEHRLVVTPAPDPFHCCHGEDIPNATKSGILQYWSLAVATIVLGVVIVLLVLFGNPGPLRPHGHSAGEGCLTEQCRHYAKLLADAANRSVPVCDNFYAHVCGGWDAIQSGMDKRSVLEDFWLQLAKKEATRLGMINAPDHPEPIHMASRFIYTCLDVLKVPMVADVREVLERGNITWPKRNERPDVLGALFYMARRVFIPVAFQVTIEKSDHSAPSPSEARTLYFGLPSRFLYNARALARLRQLGKLLDHLRLTYEAIATSFNNTSPNNTSIVNETRLKELAGQFDDLGDFFERYEKASGPVARSNNASAFLHYTPSVPKTRWDDLMKRYLNFSLLSDENTVKGGVVVQSPSVFSAIFEVHAKQGDQVTDDIVGTLCVQALVDYMSSDLLTSLLGGSRELATDSAFKRCFSDVYRFYDVTINAYFHQPLSLEVADIGRVVTLVNQTFLSRISGGNAAPSTIARGGLSENSSATSHRQSNIDMALAGFSELNASKFAQLYDHFPQVTASSISNWMELAAFAAAGGKSPTGTPLWEFLSENFGRATGKFQDFRLNLAHMEDPFYVTNVSTAVLVAGVGARIVGALYYDHVAARGMNNMAKIYADNQACLTPGSGSESPDLEIQGAVASVDVAWAALKSSSESSGSPKNSSATDNVLFFSFFCYLFCGDPDGERMCNVPLQHSTTFSGALACGSGSFMNPQKKCIMAE